MLSYALSQHSRWDAAAAAAAAATHHDMPGISTRRMNALLCDNDQSCIEQGHQLYAVRTRGSTAVQNPRAGQRVAVLGF